MQHRISNIKLLVIIVFSLTGCSAISDWADRVGEKMPVYKGVERCRQYFCFGDKKKKVQPSRPQKQPSSRQLPIKKAVPSPRHYKQKTREEQIIDDVTSKDTPWLHKKLSPEEAQMKPWERNPSWKKDLPPSPIDELKRSLDW